RTGEVFGSIQYMSPEQIEGLPADGRADVYSLACVLFEALTGEIPFVRENEVAVLWAHVHEDPPRASSKRKDVLGGTDVVVARALSKHPDDRFLTCGEFIDAFEDSLGTALTRSIMPVMRPLVARTPRPKTERDIWSPNFFPELSRVRKASRHISWLKIVAFLTAAALLVSIQVGRKGGIPKAASDAAGALQSITGGTSLPEIITSHNEPSSRVAAGPRLKHNQPATHGSTGSHHVAGGGSSAGSAGPSTSGARPKSHSHSSRHDGSGAGSFSAEPVHDHGECGVVEIEIPVPSSNVQSYLPQGFTLQETTQGVSLLGIYTELCHSSLGGSDNDDYETAAFVPVTDPHGQSAWYALALITSSKLFYRHLRSFGIGSFVADQRVDISNSGGRANSATANVPWPTSPFKFTAATGNGTCSCKNRANFWVTGTHGLVHAVYNLVFDHSDAGTGTIEFSSGTMLADIAGTTRANGEALFGHMTFSGTIRMASE
ncbi:MAG: serine/threonine-protein kinase, partial [Actinomycetota bacterium]